MLSASEILRTHDDVPDDQREEHLDMIQRAARRMHTLVTDLVDLTRMEAGALRVERDPVSLGRLIQQAARHAAPTAGEAGVELRVRAPATDVTISADQHRLLQALDNLLANAIRLTPEGGRVELAAGVAADADQDGGERSAWILVEDTGPGIDPELLPRIFDRFFQAGRSNRGSAGLGLAIVKAIVDAHGWEIDVQSEPGQGARFRITVPAPAGS